MLTRQLLTFPSYITYTCFVQADHLLEFRIVDCMLKGPNVIHIISRKVIPVPEHKKLVHENVNSYFGHTYSKRVMTDLLH